MATSRVRAIDRLAAHVADATREELVAQIICGDVAFDGQTVRDPKETVAARAAVTFHAAGFVSRGGVKLDSALTFFGVDVAGKVAVDAGSSTGGFTHALLLRGVETVHAVDVGYNQLDYRLRVDKRVIVHERTNILDVESLSPAASFGVADLSFRSLCGAVGHLLNLTSEHWAIVLLKPQFEWRDAPPAFDGRVPDDAVDRVVHETLDRFSSEGVTVVGCEESPIRGRGGNREFLVLIRK